MKTLKSIFFITLCCCLFLVSYEKKQDVKYAIISGNLENVNGEEVKLNSRFTSISFDSVPQIQHTLKIN
ncbi:hypothetical protein MHL31_01130 [Lutibacter sp. A80]|uniref:hypothetical protein n=1 Tax=Lutibacter sp. A80 TaxID=2918453 RepID=UPI001F056CC1|nr:hypothetical protein [Lutibacter sp. A80]UMB60831.1 hypothetical protein MHL31_01130 [Lutibacter sp. A80]